MRKKVVQICWAGMLVLGLAACAEKQEAETPAPSAQEESYSPEITWQQEDGDTFEEGEAFILPGKAALEERVNLYLQLGEEIEEAVTSLTVRYYVGSEMVNEAIIEGNLPKGEDIDISLYREFVGDADTLTLEYVINEDEAHKWSARYDATQTDIIEILIYRDEKTGSYTCQNAK